MPNDQPRTDLPASTSRERLAPRLVQWAARIKAAGIDNVVEALLDAAEPLGPLGAQLLWVARPALGLFVSDSAAESIDGLADVLNDPTGVGWLRTALFEQDASQDAIAKTQKGDS